MSPRKPARSATQGELLLDRPAVAQEEPWRMLADERIAPGDLGLFWTAGTAAAMVASIQRRHVRVGGSRGSGE